MSNSENKKIKGSAILELLKGESKDNPLAYGLYFIALIALVFTFISSFTVINEESLNSFLLYAPPFLLLAVTVPTFVTILKGDSSKVSIPGHILVYTTILLVLAVITSVLFQWPQRSCKFPFTKPCEENSFQGKGDALKKKLLTNYSGEVPREISGKTHNFYANLTLEKYNLDKGGNRIEGYFSGTSEKSFAIVNLDSKHEESITGIFTVDGWNSMPCTLEYSTADSAYKILLGDEKVATVLTKVTY